MTNQNNFNSAVSGASERFLAKVYGWMSFALLISGITSFLTAANFQKVMIFGANTMIFYAIVELVLVFVLSGAIHKLSAAAAGFLFITYSVVNGITLSVIFFSFQITTIIYVFGICALMFAGMAVYGAVTKNDLSGYGSFFMMTLWGVVIAGLLNFFLKSSGLDWIISIVSVVLFAGLAAFDSQKIMRISRSADDSEVFAKYSIMGALELYLDFINMFLNLLRLFGRRR